MPTEPKKVLCIHSFAGAGRCSLAIITPVLAVMGFEPVALPTVLLSTHTGGLGDPARLDCRGWCRAALAHYQALGFAHGRLGTLCVAPVWCRLPLVHG